VPGGFPDPREVRPAGTGSGALGRRATGARRPGGGLPRAARDGRRHATGPPGRRPVAVPAVPHPPGSSRRLTGTSPVCTCWCRRGAAGTGFSWPPIYSAALRGPGRRDLL